MSVYGREDYHQRALRREREQDEREKGLQSYSRELSEEKQELNQEKYQVSREKNALKEKEDQLDRDYRILHQRLKDVSERENNLEQTIEKLKSMGVWEEGRQRYSGYPEHNLAATNLLNFVFKRDEENLKKEIASLAPRNDYELPAYLQDGVLKRPDLPFITTYIRSDDLKEHFNQNLIMTALEAAIYTMYLPALTLFKEHLEILDKLGSPDPHHRQLLKQAYFAIEEARKYFNANIEPTLKDFTKNILNNIAKNDVWKLKSDLQRIGIYLTALSRESESLPNDRPSIITGKNRFYWMSLPYILKDAKRSNNQDMQNALEEMSSFYRVAAYAYLTTKIPSGQRPSRMLNRVNIGEEWEHYTHQPSTGAIFDQEGRELSGEIGQRYHDLRFDSHTGQLFNQDGEEVELVGLKVKMPKILKEAGSKTKDLTKDLGKAGYGKVKKALSGPSRVYFLFLNKGKNEGENVPLGGELAPATTIKLKVSGISNDGVRGTITLPGKGPKKGLWGKRGDLKVRYPALFVVPYDKNPGMEKFYLVAHTGLVDKNGKYRKQFTMTPTGQKFSNDKLVKEFWSDTKTRWGTVDPINDKIWQKDLEVAFGNIFKNAERHYIQEEIHSDQPVIALFAGPFSHPLDEEEPEDGGVIIHAASSSSSSLEQF